MSHRDHEVDDHELPGMIGRHPAMRGVYRLIRQVARSRLPVLLVAETGTGKELLARALHALSDANAGPFVAVNCGGFPETLVEAELFGWEKGAFTGAVARRRGRVERADGGTCFLDEADSLPLAVQVKLLRALDGYGFERLGGEETLKPVVRWVLAVQRPPGDLMHDGIWRRDFGFRVLRVVVTVPPLRNRGADRVRLARYFLTQAASGRHALPLTADAQQLIEQYPWPGNVRELEGAMETVSQLNGRRVVDAAALRPLLAAAAPSRAVELSRKELEAGLAANRWNVSATARRLGLGRTKLYEMMHAEGLGRPNGARP